MGFRSSPFPRMSCVSAGCPEQSRARRGTRRFCGSDAAERTLDGEDSRPSLAHEGKGSAAAVDREIGNASRMQFTAIWRAPKERQEYWGGSLLASRPGSFLASAEVPNCMRTWELDLAFLASFLAWFRSRAVSKPSLCFLTSGWPRP